jgi:ketosteroid isomerase-like protein
MSQANVETVRSLYEAFNLGDYAGVVEYLHPEAEVSPAVVGLDPAGPGSGGRLCGREGVRRYVEDYAETWETVAVELAQVAEAPHDRVLAVEDWRMRGRDDLEVVTRCIDVYEFRDGLIFRGVGYVDKAVALEAAGLSE